MLKVTEITGPLTHSNYTTSGMPPQKGGVSLGHVLVSRAEAANLLLRGPGNAA